MCPTCWSALSSIAETTLPSLKSWDPATKHPSLLLRYAFLFHIETWQALDIAPIPISISTTLLRACYCCSVTNGALRNRVRNLLARSRPWSTLNAQPRLATIWSTSSMRQSRPSCSSPTRRRNASSSKSIQRTCTELYIWLIIIIYAGNTAALFFYFLSYITRLSIVLIDL